jgi:putative RecB family exonuclease
MSGIGPRVGDEVARRPWRSAPSPELSYPCPTVTGMAQMQCTAGPDGLASSGEPGDVPRRPALSPSRANDFKQCPLLYRFRAIDRLPEVPTAAQVRGTLVHAVLERLFLLPAHERTPEAARALLCPTWARLCEDDPGLPAALFGDGSSDTDRSGPDRHDPATQAEDAVLSEGTPARVSSVDAGRSTAEGASTGDVQAWLTGAGRLLDAYFALEDPRLLEPEARELLVEVELESGLLLRGYVDRVDRTGTDGATIRVVDYKTGSAPRPIAEARALFQMKFYALALLMLRGVMPTELRLLYLTGPEVLHYTPDEAQLRRFARTLEAIWAAIRTAGSTGDFRPNPGPSCGWCGYKPLCPAWDGVPPPYPGWPEPAVSPGRSS